MRNPGSVNGNNNCVNQAAVVLAVAVATVTALRYGSAGCDAGASEGSSSMTRTCLARRENDVGEPSTKLTAAQLHDGSCQKL